MMWKWAIFIFISTFLALSISPQLGISSYESRTIVTAPPHYVREQLLGLETIPRMHRAGKDATLYALRRTGGGSMLDAHAGDKIVLSSAQGTSSIAKVIVHNSTALVWRLDRNWGQRVYYSYTFTQTDEPWMGFPEGSTWVAYKRTWRGSDLQFVARKFLPGLEWLIGENFPHEGDRKLGFSQDGVIAEIRERWGTPTVERTSVSNAWQD